VRVTRRRRRSADPVNLRSCWQRKAAPGR